MIYMKVSINNIFILHSICFVVMEDDNDIPKPVSFTSIVFQELIEKGTFLLVHHATIKKTDVLVKQLKGNELTKENI